MARAPGGAWKAVLARLSLSPFVSLPLSLSVSRDVLHRFAPEVGLFFRFALGGARRGFRMIVRF